MNGGETQAVFAVLVTNTFSLWVKSVQLGETSFWVNNYTFIAMCKTGEEKRQIWEWLNLLVWLVIASLLTESVSVWKVFGTSQGLDTGGVGGSDGKKRMVEICMSCGVDSDKLGPGSGCKGCRGGLEYYTLKRQLTAEKRTDLKVWQCGHSWLWWNLNGRKQLKSAD